MTVPDVAPVVDADALSPAMDFFASASSFFAPSEWFALTVALAVVACLAPGGWRDARWQEMTARQRAEAGLPRA
jgi:hypothetical protein